MRWTSEDRAKAIAFQIEKGQRCTMCGTAPWEWEENRYAYEPSIKICRGCEIKESVSEQTDRRPGLTVELAPTAGIEAARRQLAMERRARILARDTDEPKPIPTPPSTPSMASGVSAESMNSRVSVD
jgi:hypothetical protein